ncbi:hypothetical protein C5167_043460 [Papaver somniferum]|uniref:Uncharacterized protein n=1 Tax=Papaver somniferum TaxID=3469 RepID=A0A4Y7L7G9_PAPSO|nr:hypothetical protein C5167_043460 [Papaver somniferum]
MFPFVAIFLTGKDLCDLGGCPKEVGEGKEKLVSVSGNR